MKELFPTPGRCLNHVSAPCQVSTKAMLPLLHSPPCTSESAECGDKETEFIQVNLPVSVVRGPRSWMHFHGANSLSHLKVDLVNTLFLPAALDQCLALCHHDLGLLVWSGFKIQWILRKVYAKYRSVLENIPNIFPNHFELGAILN